MKKKKRQRETEKEKAKETDTEREKCTAAASMESCHGLLKKSLDLSLGALFCFFFERKGKKVATGV